MNFKAPQNVEFLFLNKKEFNTNYTDLHKLSNQHLNKLPNKHYVQRIKKV